jgi:D-beta-D-heptose 7-phosphate kinase/D-beta-D-heptose 1-phosphate adenosyltransferase
MTTSATGSALPRERIEDLTRRAAGRRVVVVGDVMLDRYLRGDTDRLSPEAPVPVVTIREAQAALGGAANVAANVAAIGATCVLVGIVGDDSNGRSIRAELAAQRLDDRYLLTTTGRPTTTKTRVVARGQQIVRIDEETDTLLEGADLERMSRQALDALESADALLVEDYNKGALPPALIHALMGAARARGVPVVVDPKFRQFFEYRGATVFKPNRRELEAALGAAVDLQHVNALPEALGRLHADNLLVTKDHEVTRIPSLAREVFDVSGAGDTVTAWVGTMLAAGATVREAALLANYAAGIEVGKAGVATVSPDEVLAVHERAHDQIGRLRRGGLL